MPAPPRIDPAKLQILAERLRGPLLAPDDRGYDDTRRPWNGIFDRHPGAIARCTGVADVMAAVDFARDNELLLAVRGTGHSYAGHSTCEGGILLDLSGMDSVRVDPRARRARVGPGATWGGIDHETQALCLATTGATVSTVGVAGYTLGGGTGHLARKYGLSLDNLLSADVVTADGRMVHASEEHEPDLFWGLRGGGGNLGVVTSFEFTLHDVGPEILAGQVIHRFEDAGDVLRFYRSFMAEAPDELQCYAFLLGIPPIPAFPEELHGKTALSLVVAYAGEVADGQSALEPLRNFGSPVVDGVQPQPYTTLQTAFDQGMPKGHRWYSRARYLDALPDAAIDTLLDGVDPLPGPFSMVYLEPLGGAIARIPSTATAFPHRSASYSLHIFPGWNDPADDDRMKTWARELHEAMAPHSIGGVYVNLLGSDEGERVRAAYGENYQRLAQLKNTYDPRNLFNMNWNVEPMESGS